MCYEQSIGPTGSVDLNWQQQSMLSLKRVATFAWPFGDVLGLLQRRLRDLPLHFPPPFLTQDVAPWK